MKEKALKAKYDKEIMNQKLKKFSNSSYLTPEAAMYLNEAIESGATRVEEEIVYAGLHDPRKKELKFKRTKQYSSRYTKPRSTKRHRKGRFG